MQEKIIAKSLARTQDEGYGRCVDAREQATALHERTPARPRYRFKDGIWQVISDLMQWPSVSAAATHLGVSDTTLSRAIKGETAPGEVLMARLMHELPRSWKHEHVFDLVEEPVPA